MVDLQPDSEIYVISDFEMHPDGLLENIPLFDKPTVHCVDFNMVAEPEPPKVKKGLFQKRPSPIPSPAPSKNELKQKLEGDSGGTYYQYRKIYAESMATYTGGTYTHVDASGGKFKIVKFLDEEALDSTESRDKLIAQKRARIAEIDVQINDLQSLVDRINAQKSGGVK